MKYMRISWKNIIWIIPAFTIIILLILDFSPSGQLEMSYDFEHTSPFISRLSPDGRVLEIRRNEDGEYYQPMVIEPVYFDVRLPQAFERVKVEILYDKPSKIPFKLGFRTPGEWSWILKDMTPIDGSGNWTHGITDFELNNARYDNGNIRFILASPRLDESGDEIKIHRINMLFTKEALRFNNFWYRVKEYARTWIE